MAGPMPEDAMVVADAAPVASWAPEEQPAGLAANEKLQNDILARVRECGGPLQFLEKKLSDESTKQGFTDWLKSTFVEALMAASD